jgi:LmbE family N-acetylglucosaminyl deacetylase
MNLNVLSPHLDDAAFSLCIALHNWSKMGVSVRVVNFFTISAYAPRAMSQNPAHVSTIRKLEDRRALRLIGDGLHIESLDLLDAPLRLNLEFESIFKPEAGARRPPGEIDALAFQLRQYFLSGHVLAPLALGNHVDHSTVLAAAIANKWRSNLGFYEDLPYAIRTSATSLHQRISEVEKQTRVRLRPVILRMPHAALFKHRVTGLYQSQISREEARAIARFSARYGGGERIWIPKNTRSWRDLVDQTT